MPAYFIVCLIAVPVILFLLARLFYFGKKSLANQLLTDAMRAENNGNYTDAISFYENALEELKKARFQYRLKAKIIEKLKVLNTVKTYNHDQEFVRRENSWIG